MARTCVQVMFDATRTIVKSLLWVCKLLLLACASREFVVVLVQALPFT